MIVKPIYASPQTPNVVAVNHLIQLKKTIVVTNRYINLGYRHEGFKGTYDDTSTLSDIGKFPSLTLSAIVNFLTVSTTLIGKATIGEMVSSLLSKSDEDNVKKINHAVIMDFFFDSLLKMIKEDLPLPVLSISKKDIMKYCDLEDVKGLSALPENPKNPVTSKVDYNAIVSTVMTRIFSHKWDIVSEANKKHYSYMVLSERDKALVVDFKNNPLITVKPYSEYSENYNPNDIFLGNIYRDKAEFFTKYVCNKNEAGEEMLVVSCGLSHNVNRDYDLITQLLKSSEGSQRTQLIFTPMYLNTNEEENTDENSFLLVV